MPRQTRAEIDRELDEIAALVAKHPDGISRKDLETAYEALHERRLTKRTMNRRLSQLEAEQRVRSDDARGSVSARYFPPAEGGHAAPSPGITTAGAGTVADPDYVPISAEGAEVRALVRRPLVLRTPVGYDAGFLTSYVPGETWYLPRDVRARLLELGRTSDTVRPAGTFAREINESLLIDLSWASSRLEGNKYTRLDTRELIRFGRAATGADATETQMILNHKAAIQFLVDEADRVGFNRYTAFNLHKALSENLLSNSDDEGRLRRGLIGIGGTVYQPLDVPQRVEECFDLVLDKAAGIPDPFEQAFFMMVHLPYLQPFIDVNKRTSRLLANVPLIRGNLCPLSFVGVSDETYVDGTLGVYELTRIELLRDVFTAACARSSERYRAVRERMGTPDPIRLQYRDELRAVVASIVQGDEPPLASIVGRWAVANDIPAEDQAPFVERAVALLDGLDETDAYKYRITEPTIRKWMDRHRR